MLKDFLTSSVKFTALWLILGAGCAIGQTVRLLDEVHSSGSLIHLADLLPVNAPDGIRQLYGEIEIGQSPRFGSRRVLTKAQIEQKLAAFPGLLQQLVTPEQIRVTRAGYQLSHESVVEAVAKFLHQPIPLSGVQWAQETEAAEQHPILEAVRADVDQPHRRLQVTLRCLRHSVCPAFLASIDSGTTAFYGLNFARTKQAENAAPTLVRSGQKATLLIEDGQVRISLPVICLQRGQLSQTIRVLDPVNRRIFQAKVLSEQLLRMTS